MSALYAIRRPSGENIGWSAPWSPRNRLRAVPPERGTTQMSPAYANAISFADTVGLCNSRGPASASASVATAKSRKASKAQRGMEISGNDGRVAPRGASLILASRPRVTAVTFGTVAIGSGVAAEIARFARHAQAGEQRDDEHRAHVPRERRFVAGRFQAECDVLGRAAEDRVGDGIRE